MKLVAPHVHLNGTSKAELLEQLENIYTALGEAYDAVKRSAPNGRDYYPLPPDAMEAAREQHVRRLTVIDSLRNELVAQCNMIESGVTMKEVDGKAIDVYAERR